MFLYTSIKGNITTMQQQRAFEIFRHKLPLELTATQYADRLLLNAYPHVQEAPIIVSFIYAYPQFARQEVWGLQLF
ncbi:staygreen family protein [Metabacillus malikii]